MSKTTPRVAIFISFSGQGGVERMITNLARGFLDAGCEVDMVLARTRDGHLESIPEGVNQIRLGAKHTVSALPGLIRYLRRENPSALLAVKDRGIKVAVMAKFLSAYRGRLVGRIGTTVWEAISGKGAIRRWIWYSGMRLFYPRADHIVAVSEGVAGDIRTITGLPPSRVTVVPNPVIFDDMFERSKEDVEHPWVSEGKVPLILGIGRLTEQKDFPTLIRAFANLQKTLSSKLVILGEGRQRNELEELVSSLGIVDHVHMPGFESNPYAWIARSSLFVLSSKWEGSPNVLTESLALGTPVVSTDCRSGPREILNGGRYGPLVPVGDHIALSAAMGEVIKEPPESDQLRSAAAQYSIENSAGGYLQTLGICLQ
jgi:glycosyltransferase involved in cell wall biosynthesis